MVGAYPILIEYLYSFYKALSSVTEMAEEDIYGSKRKYEKFMQEYPNVLTPGSPGKGTYRCRNPKNFEYFPVLFRAFDARDLSYIRRYRILHTMRFVVGTTQEDLKCCERSDIDELVAAMHRTHQSADGKMTFIRDLKYIWKALFPETDEKGRVDETIVPYAVRHLSARVDKSREKRRGDRLSEEEFAKLVNYFSLEPRIQSYLTLSLESLARPQELLYVRLRDVELHDEYAKVFISEHGKEGVGVLQCIDSYPYLVKWLQVHPLKSDGSSFLYVNTGNTGTLKQLKPANINKMIRKACKDLGIPKPVTCYSLKRNGVTLRRLRGESDVEIQHAARWTSTKQLKTYDQSGQDDSFRLALERRGILQPKGSAPGNSVRICGFCNWRVGFSEVICPKCLRPLDRHKAIAESEAELGAVKAELVQVKQTLSAMKEEIVEELMAEVMRRMQTGTSNGISRAPGPLPDRFSGEQVAEAQDAVQ